MERQRDRFKDLPWFPKQDIHVLIGGAGGIGSWTTFLLCRAGFKPIVWDFDKVEAHNIGGQLYNVGQVGMYKVDALGNVCYEFTSENITTMRNAIDETSMTHAYCIAAFDNMKARRDMFEKWASEYAGNPDALFIDGRLEAEQMFIFCMRGDDGGAQEAYMSELVDDSEIEEAPCTARQTSHAAAMIASHIVGFFTNHITNVVEADKMRQVPYRWEYFIPIDLHEIKF